MTTKRTSTKPEKIALVLYKQSRMFGLYTETQVIGAFVTEEQAHFFANRCSAISSDGSKHAYEVVTVPLVYPAAKNKKGS